MCASVVAAFSCSFSFFFFMLCCFIFFLVCMLLFSVGPRFWCSQTPVMLLKEHAKPQPHADEHSHLFLNCMLSNIMLQYWWCVFPRLDIVYVAFQTNHLWNAFMWFPISPFSNEAKIWCNTFANIYTPKHLNGSQNYTLLSLYETPDASSGLIRSLIVVVVVVVSRHIKVSNFF